MPKTMKSFHHLWVVVVLGFGAPACKKPHVAESQAVPAPPNSGDYVVAKLERIVIPIIDFEDIPVEEAVDFLRMRSVELEEGPPEQRGISFIIKGARPRADDKSVPELGLRGLNQVPKINYRAKNVGLVTAVKEIARLARLDVYLTNVGIVLCPPGEAPLPVGKMSEEEVWKTLHKESESPEQPKGEPSADGSRQ